ncbi:MAG: hypothetical protein ACRD6X_19580 [Pyrinomonadaceae bacterium]
MKWIVAICVVVGGSFSFAFGQTKQLTNADLEKYKTKRLQAEKDLRENYEKLGFPSPAELEKQNAQDEKERFALFQRLQTERIEREQIAAERQRLIYEYTQRNQPYVIVERSDYSGYLFGFSIIGNRRFPWRSQFPYHGGIRWRAGGGGVIYEPGSSSHDRTTPIFLPQRRLPTFIQRR